MGRRSRLLLAAASLATCGAMLLVPAVSSAASESSLAIRGIDATDRDNVKVTFLYTGAAQDLKGLTIREDRDESAYIATCWRRLKRALHSFQHVRRACIRARLFELCQKLAHVSRIGWNR